MARNIKARRKLEELYAIGVEVRFDAEGGHKGPFDEPPSDDAVAMWLTPPSPLQRESSLREANAARARALLRIRRDEDSEEYLTAKAFLSEMSDETLIDYLILHEGDERRQEAIRDVLARDEWKDITDLQDAMRQFDESGADEDDPEWKPLLDRDAEYGTQIAQREKELTEAAREAFRMFTRESLEKKGMEKRGDLVGSQAFMQEYERQMTYNSVRDPEQNQLLFFESALEWADQADVIRNFISDVLAAFIQEGSEAKNSQGVVSGLDSSALPSEPEISEVSIPTEPSESTTSPGSSK